MNLHVFKLFQIGNDLIFLASLQQHLQTLRKVRGSLLNFRIYGSCPNLGHATTPPNKHGRVIPGTM